MLGSKKLVAGVVVALALFGGRAAFAAIPDANGTIHTCYNTKSGALRITDTPKPKACTTHETPLDMGKQGPKGVPGPPGPAGDVAANVYMHSSYTDVLSPLNGTKVVNAWGINSFGSYLVNGKVVIGTFDSGSTVSCKLLAFPSNTVIDSAYATVVTPPNGVGETTLSLVGAADVAIVQLECTASNGFVTDSKLTLQPVQNIDAS